MNNVYNCCKICGKKLSGRQLTFCSIHCKNKYFQNYDIQLERATKKRALLIDKFGGKCEFCGYKSSKSTLLFTKNYSPIHLTGREIANHDLNHLLNKLEGAKLACKNCASEIENNDLVEIKKLQKTLDFKIFIGNLKTCGINKNQTLVLGVSGGVDSVVLLDLFHKTGFKNIIVTHLNHGVRAEADSDQKFVQDLAKNYGYAFETKSIKRPLKGNLENELRKIRRDFLQKIAQKHQASSIVLAHNSNDQAETIVLNLVRGAGPSGLSGMEMSEGSIKRPILNISREEIESYAKKNNLKWHEDITNRDLSFKRNFVRHKVLPLFKEINPEFLSNIQRTSSLIGNINNYLENQAKIISTTDVNELRKLDDALLYQTLILSYEKASGTRENLELKHLETIKSLLDMTGGSKKIDLPNGIIAKRSYSTLEFLTKKEDNMASPEEKSLTLGENHFGKWLIVAEKINKKILSKNQEFLILDESDFKNLKIRPRTKGDKINKVGITGSKKVQDLFVDAKIEKDERDYWPVVVTNDNKIIWIPKIAISRNVKSTSNKLIKLTAKER